MKNVIDRFSGEFRFLSNFSPSPIRVGEILYPTVEHAFQAAKSFDTASKLRIASARSPGKAKSMGRQLRLRNDWESVKVSVMRQLVEFKFTTNADLAELLLATGNAELIEGNTWNDCFWGVSRGRGKNHLGRILMQTRSRLRATEIHSA